MKQQRTSSGSQRRGLLLISLLLSFSSAIQFRLFIKLRRVYTLWIRKQQTSSGSQRRGFWLISFLFSVYNCDSIRICLSTLFEFTHNLKQKAADKQRQPEERILIDLLFVFCLQLWFNSDLFIKIAVSLCLPISSIAVILEFAVSLCLPIFSIAVILEFAVSLCLAMFSMIGEDCCIWWFYLSPHLN